MGKTGRGTHEYCGVMDRVDILTGTLGKALGGAKAAATRAVKEIVELLRQRSRPYLFQTPSHRRSLRLRSRRSICWGYVDDTSRQAARIRNTFAKITAVGLEVLQGEHPMGFPVMFGDAEPAVKMAEKMLGKGVYVAPFSFPVVPKGKAGIARRFLPPIRRGSRFRSTRSPNQRQSSGCSRGEKFPNKKLQPKRECLTG